MKFDNINKAPCIGEKVPVVIEDTEDARCLSDPLYAAIMGENFCTNAPVIEGFEIRDPNGVTIGSSGTASFTAKLILKYTDGTKKAIDVTKESSWASAKSVILESKGNGEFKAGETDVDTQVKVTATYTPSIIVDGETKNYTHQLSGSSTVSIKQNCAGSAIDIVVVLDRSASMLKTDSAISGTETRMQAAREACRQLIKNSKLWDSEDDKIVTSGGSSVNPTVGKEIDRMAFISYAGDGTDGDPESRVTLVSDFVDTKVAALSLVDDPGFLVSKDCDGGTGPEGGGCWTSIGGGLEMAYDLLKGSNEKYNLPAEGARTTATNKAAHLENPTGVALSGNSAWPRKLIILLTDGYENVCAPDPITIATNIRGDKMAGSGLKTLGHDAMIAVVGFMLDSTKSIKRCSGGSPSGATVTVENYLKLIANCYQNDTSSATSLTFFPTNHDALKGLFSGILQTICKDNTGGSTGNNRACFYIPTTGLGKGDTPQLRDQIGIHSSLKNWKVCKNSVDLMGKDLFNTTHPNAGMYVSLIGNTGYSLLSEENQTQDGDQWELKSKYSEDVYGGKKCQVTTAPIDYNFGGIETISDFSFNEGEAYRLVLKVGGNKIKNKAAFTNQHGTYGYKLGSSIRVSVGGTQKGYLQDDVRATYPDKDGIVDGGIVDSIPILVTRKISGVFHEEAKTIDPEKGLHDIVIILPPGDGKKHKIRIEQYPYAFQKVLKDPTFTGYEIPKKERERIFKDKGCINIKGTSESPLKISDFSGFMADVGVVVAGDRNEDSRYLTSGADEFLAPLPYGVVIAEVTLQKGTSSGDTWTTTETIFTENFESETTPT